MNGKQLLIDSVKFLALLVLLGVLVVALAGCDRETTTLPAPPVVRDVEVRRDLEPAVRPTPTPSPEPRKRPKPPAPEQPSPQSPDPKPTPTPLPSPGPVCLCHNSKLTLCGLTQGAWDAHLRHGDTVGVCR